jgi:diguanylate cyclase (GGDEF)-like protein
MSIENAQVKEQLTEIELNEETFIKMQGASFLQMFNHSISDLSYLVDTFDPQSDGMHIEWSAILQSSKKYKKIAYIDTEGRESVRIDYNNETDAAEEPERYEDISEEIYFQRAAKLDEGQIYVSQILMDKSGAQQNLYTMFCAPIYSPELSGVLVLVCNTGLIFDEFGTMTDETNGEIYIINEYGYWTSAEGVYRDIDTKYYDIVYDVGILPKERWKSEKDQKHVLGEYGFYTFEEVNFSEGIIANQSADGQKIVMQASHCKLVTLIGNGSPYDYYIHNTAWSKVGKIISERYIYLIIFFLISVLVGVLVVRNKINMERMRNTSDFDFMTKAYTRLRGFELLNQYIENISFYKKICLCFIDINGLKEVNDTLGHPYGDELITTVVDTIRNTIREQDIIIRMGGDEFLIVFTRVDKSISEVIWSRIRESFKGVNTMEDRQYIISASHGIVEINEDKKNIDLSDVVTQADDKMYEEKTRIKKNLNVIRRKF